MTRLSFRGYVLIGAALFCAGAWGIVTWSIIAISGRLG